MNMRRTSTGITIATALASVVAAAPVCASDTDAAQRAQELFERGRVLLDEGKNAEACDAFAQSMRLESAGGTQLNLALCHELVGKLATAMQAYRDALDRAVADGREDRIRFASKRLEVVSTRVARFSVEIEDATDLTVHVDGRPVPRASLERAIPLDPGPHVIVVSRSGRAVFEHRVVVPNVDGWQGQVKVPEAAASAAPAPPAVRQDSPDPTPRRSSPRTEDSEQPQGERTTWHWAGLTVGVLGLATSAVSGVQALRAESEADDACIPERDYCSAEGEAAGDRANDYAWASTASLGVGLAGLAVFVWLPRERAESTVGLSATPGGALFTASGRF